MDTATGGLYESVTLTSQVVVYAPAERAEKFSLSLLSLPYSVVAAAVLEGHPLYKPYIYI